VVLGFALLLATIPLSDAPASGYASSEVVVRFAPNAVDRQANGVNSFSGEIVNDAELRSELVSLGADQLATVCDGWRSLDAEEQTLDINGTRIVGSLIDFGDVYVVTYTSGTDPEEAASDLGDLPAVLSTLNRATLSPRRPAPALRGQQ